VPQVRIPAHCLTSNNRHVRARQLWGTDVYTEDSDLVAVLMHCGYWYHSRKCLYCCTLAARTAVCAVDSAGLLGQGWEAAVPCGCMNLTKS
jgi:hypothetical protein